MTHGLRMVVSVVLALALGACGGGGGSQCPAGTERCGDGECHACCPGVACAGGKCCADFTCQECCGDGDCSGATPVCGVDRRCHEAPCRAIGETCQDDCCSGAVCCTDGKCHQCCQDSDCPEAGMVCTAGGTCEKPCIGDGQYCTSDPGACCAGLACDLFDSKCRARCVLDTDCIQRTDVPHATDLLCGLDGVCDYAHCELDSECSSARVCQSGDCLSPAGCAEVASCRIWPPWVVFMPGYQVQLVAGAFRADGTFAAGLTFDWSSAAPASADVGANGLLTGGATASGTVELTATVRGCNTQCHAWAINIGDPPPVGTRAAAVDAETGAPVKGAFFQIDDLPAARMDASGSWVYDRYLDAEHPGAVTVADPAYEFITIAGVTWRDLVIPLRRLMQPDRAGGVAGRFSFERIRCPALHPCEMSLALAGFSLPGFPLDVAPDFPWQDVFRARFMFDDLTYDLRLPGGQVWLNDTSSYKNRYSVSAAPENRVFFGLGGKLDVSEFRTRLLPFLQAADGGDSLGLVYRMLNLAASHGALAPNQLIAEIPLVADRSDLDGDGDRTELVPDYQNFNSLDLPLVVAQGHRLRVTVPQFPGNAYDSVLLLAGIHTPAGGFVPLGLAAGFDSDDPVHDPPDGLLPGPVEVRVSEVAGRMPEAGAQRMLLALAWRAGDATQRAGQVVLLDDFDGELALDAFLTPPLGSFSAAERKIEIGGMPAGAHLAVAEFSAADGRPWRVFAELPRTVIALPPSPTGTDRAAAAGLIAMRLQDGWTFPKLFGFGENDLWDLPVAVAAFSYADLP